MEQKEITLPIQENGQYKNLSLKQKWDEGTMVRTGLGDREFIIVTKGDFNKGHPINGQYGLSFSCKVKYQDEDVSFFLNEAEHDRYKDIGAGEPMKIINLKESYVLKGVEKKNNVLHFSLVE